jgi:hypothetical protein
MRQVGREQTSERPTRRSRSSDARLGMDEDAEIADSTAALFDDLKLAIGKFGKQLLPAFLQ